MLPNSNFKRSSGSDWWCFLYIHACGITWKKKKRKLSQYCMEDQGKFNLENKIMASMISCQRFNGHLWCKSIRVVFFLILFIFILLFIIYYLLISIACSIFVQWPGIDLHLLEWKHLILTSGLPGNSQIVLNIFEMLQNVEIKISMLIIYCNKKASIRTVNSKDQKQTFWHDHQNRNIWDCRKQW